MPLCRGGRGLKQAGDMGWVPLLGVPLLGDAMERCPGRGPSRTGAGPELVLGSARTRDVKRSSSAGCAALRSSQAAPGALGWF